MQVSGAENRKHYLMSPQRLFLVGPMGAGKTTVGRHLAKRLAWHFTDTDAEIVRQAGQSIPQIFADEGEDGFRIRERQVIDQLTQVDRRVLALGGGSLLCEMNRHHLMHRGRVIFLCCSPEQQYQRTRYSKHRPLLNTPNPLARLQALWREREPVYRAAADHVVSVEQRTVAQVVEQVLMALT
ncbi:MAG: shikimate kinase [Pseudomonadota bacterium]